jgi:hypothetical protein
MNSIGGLMRNGLGGALLALLCGIGPAVSVPKQVLSRLNGSSTVQGTDQSKSYRVLFDAYLKMSQPPQTVSPQFNLNTIHPGMSQWKAVSDWAESNPQMAAAILECRSRNILGVPYGAEEVDSAYRDAGLKAEIGMGGSLRRSEFPYLHAMDTIAAYATAEIYRLLEASRGQAAIELAVANNWVLRQLCDRQFLNEKLHAIQLLIDALANLRDAMYRYRDVIDAAVFADLAKYDIPALRPDRNRLHVPEGDRIVSEALLEEVFDPASHQADPERFASTFASIQSANAPLTRFGAARRWRMIAAVHGSLQASKERLELIYDDWWRRWRVQEYDVLLEQPTQFERTNRVRYAAVIYSMQDIAEAFSVRNQLIAAVNGTAVAAGLCGYRKTYNVYPDDKEKTYGQFVRKVISDIDPFDEEFGRLRYRRVDSRDTIDAGPGRLRLEAGECILYSKGQDHQDGRAREHTDDGAAGDLVLWPPIKALAREQKLID